MAWNEPGNGDKNKPEGPPELDKVFKDISNKFASLFGKKSNNGAASGGDHTIKSSKPFIIGIVVLLIIAWLLSGIFIVSPAERAVVLQFGKYLKTDGPGPHWLPRFIQSETTVDVQKISNYAYSAQMLTKDQNIVDVSVAVQYRIDNARNYLYNLVNANNSVQQATASALRQVMGNTTLDEVLTSGRAVVRQAVLEQLKKILKLYHAGIEITDVALQPARAPAEVKAAFDDAIKAQEDELRYQNQAEAYANGVVPIAEGKAKRILQEAKAYQQKVVLAAKGNIAKFNAIYSVYKTAPNVTKERLYLTALENVLQKSSKVFVDTKGSNNLLYLPLTKLLAHPNKNSSLPNTNETQVSTTLANEAGLSESQNSNNDWVTNRPSRGDLNNPDSIVGQGDRT